MARQHDDGNHGGREAQVKYDGQNSEESNAAETAGQDYGEDEVKTCCARYALYCLLVGRDVDVSVGVYGEEVAVEAC